MNKIVLAFSVTLAVNLLVGCEVTGPHVRLKPPITVEGDDHHDGNHRDHDNRDGDFCPPGQAKKGRC